MKNKSKIFTSKNIDKLFFILVLSLIFSANLYAQNEALIDLDSTHQMIRGFGAANIIPWRPDMSTGEIIKAFGTDDGQIGLSILRLRIPPQKSEFSINVHTAELAHTYYDVTIFASPWNAPPEMLDTASAVKRIDTAMYDEYAAHLDSFNTYMTNNGVPIYAISVQNEPDYDGGWTQWTAAEMLTFMQNNAPSIGTRVMAPESFQFRRQMSDPILNDSAACANLDILGGHIYGGGLSPYPLAESKGKEIWMTEHYTESANSGNLWPLALNVGTEIHNVMVAGMSAYVWWYIVRFYGPIADGTYAPKGTVTKRGFVMSQFARFIRPGYLRLECTDNPQLGVYTSAYIDTSADSTVFVVAVNDAPITRDQTFVFQNGVVDRVRPYITSGTKSCSRESVIEVINDSFSITLEAKSITTFASGAYAGVEEDTPSDQASFKLSQNYPNPLNTTTTIEYSIDREGFVKLAVYNTLGQEVKNLVGEVKAAGVYTVKADLRDLPPGIYLYRLETSGHSIQKKMIVIR